MQRRIVAFSSILFIFLLSVGMTLVVAQEDSPPVAAPEEVSACGTVLEAVWTAASDACIGRPDGFVCNGGSAPEVLPGGAVGNALALVGSLVEATAIESIRTPVIAPEANVVGVAWLRVEEPLSLSGLMLGDVTVTNVTPPDFPAWQSVIVETDADFPTCDAAPLSGFIVQSPANANTRIAVNGVSLALNGTVMVKTVTNNTVFVGISGLASVLALGESQPLRAGQQIVVSHNVGDFSTPVTRPGEAQPLNLLMTNNIPVSLLDRPVLLPQPGFVATQGNVNLRSQPNVNSALLLEVPAGEIMSVLGRTEDGEWYHVRLGNGVTGWMFASLLAQSVGNVEAVYSATPAPPQRFGEAGRIARVNAAAGVNLRSAPALGFPIVATLVDGTEVNLLARSPYSPWVKVDASGTVGWVALLPLETRSVIEALPIDFNVPPPPDPPTPTPIPGSFGNAFPDPRGGG